ncbi:MAG TPA: hypothetical protein VNI52_14695 [Sphingobacteriaceae bacterium]|nr:hypothetical protein [Sphingobacteriaceae bacterium]
MKRCSKGVVFIVYLLLISLNSFAQEKLELSNERLKLIWNNSKDGWKLTSMLVQKGNIWQSPDNPSGEYTLLYSPEKPNSKTSEIFKTKTGFQFPEPIYHKQLKNKWDESTNAVSLNTAGKAYHFLPSKAQRNSPKSISFTHELEFGSISTQWNLDPDFPTDILVKQSLTVKKAGFYSLASPTLASVSANDLEWATVPGYFQGNRMEKNFVAAYAYGHGIPELPVIYRERCASTLSPIVTSKRGITYSVIPDPTLGRDPWAKDQNTNRDWFIGLSHKNRKSELSPTLYYPVLGEPKSELKAGDKITYEFRYSVSSDGWFKTLNHAIYDVFKFKESLALREARQSLSARIEKMHHYVTNPQTSLWKTDEFQSLKIGAQAYLGAVVGSKNKDAIKNSDYGAMWMLANSTKDPVLVKDRLPYALNFKLVQQQTKDGFFKGAAIGQYYLLNSKKFVEEWGEIVEPIAVTYYTIVDMGNVLLFEPKNAELKRRLQLGAESLLKWQQADGSWAVAYDRKTEEEVFKDVKDLRPTFYGLVVAYQVLKDKKYLAAAKKGADWYVENAVKTGSFLGVCGDMRYAPDFATVQSAQALLEIYNLTGNEAYKEAAVMAAKFYTTSIYTHPIASKEIKNVKGIKREDWEISQAGLSFEHGGIIGSANTSGPIQLASHAGLFIRMYQYTKEPIFADMARAAAIGRDAFVDPKTNVASYYWAGMNNGPGAFPHHAWWQIGWITDYLMAEAEMRTEGKIVFPRGYITPKVGSHQTYGFKPGKVFGKKANLMATEGYLVCDKPQVDYIITQALNSKRTSIIFLNNQLQTIQAKINWGDKTRSFKKLTIKDQSGKTISKQKLTSETLLDLTGYGLKVIVLE